MRVNAATARQLLPLARPQAAPTTDAVAPLAVDMPEAARLAGVSVSTIRRAIARGDLKAAKIFTSTKIRLVDLDSFLAAAAGSTERAIVPAPIVTSSEASAS